MASREERFEELFARTQAPLMGYAVRRVGDPADAADVVAETYLVAWRRLDELPPGEETRLWLFGVARRVLANHHRGERRRLALADRLRDDLGELADGGGLPAPGESEAVARALRRLSADDRELLTLVAWEGLSREEVALTLGVTRAVIRLRLHRARGRLAIALKAEDVDLQRFSQTGHVPAGRANAHPGLKEA